jgi:hypothetical protein
MRNDGALGSLWRLALSALVALALMVGPVAARTAMAEHDCGMHDGAEGSQHAHHGAKVIDNVEPRHDVHEHGTRPHRHPDTTAKNVPGLADAGLHQDHGAAQGEDCCNAMCQTACMTAASVLDQPLMAFNVFRPFIAADFVSVVPGQPDRPPSPFLSM